MKIVIIRKLINSINNNSNKKTPHLNFKIVLFNFMNKIIIYKKDK